MASIPTFHQVLEQAHDPPKVRRPLPSVHQGVPFSRRRPSSGGSINQVGGCPVQTAVGSAPRGRDTCGKPGPPRPEGGLPRGGEAAFVVSVERPGRVSSEVSPGGALVERAPGVWAVFSGSSPLSGLGSPPRASQPCLPAVVTRTASLARERGVTAQAGPRREALVRVQTPMDHCPVRPRASPPFEPAAPLNRR